MRVGVLVSGSGTNLQALIDAGARGDLDPAVLGVVGSNVPGCAALRRADDAGIATFSLAHQAFPSRPDFDAAVVASLRAHAIDLVVLAGFMRVVTPVFLDAFPGRVLNIHPSLLPAFPGVHSQAQAFHHGVKIAGCTVHLVDGGVDSGPIVAQSAVPVLDGDDEETLRARILAEEHRLLPRIVRDWAAGTFMVEGRHVRRRPL